MAVKVAAAALAAPQVALGALEQVAARAPLQAQVNLEGALLPRSKVVVAQLLGERFFSIQMQHSTL